MAEAPVVLTSLRIGELLSIQWKDIDWTNAKLRITRNVWRGHVQASTKTGAVIVRHLPAVLVATLRMHRQQSKFAQPEDYVFPRADGAVMDADSLRRTVLYPAMDRVGIDRGYRTHGFHIFRHSAGSIVRAQTGDMKLAQV
jgi:integrase